MKLAGHDVTIWNDHAPDVDPWLSDSENQVRPPLDGIDRDRSGVGQRQRVFCQRWRWVSGFAVVAAGSGTYGPRLPSDHLGTTTKKVVIGSASLVVEKIGVSRTLAPHESSVAATKNMTWGYQRGSTPGLGACMYW